MKAFGDMGQMAWLRLNRDCFIAGHNSCELRRYLDSVPLETPIRDVVDVGCGRVMRTQRFGGSVNQ